MKRLWLFAFLAISLSLFTTSCEDDGPIEPPVIENFAPTLDFLSDDPTGEGQVVSDEDFVVQSPGAFQFQVALEGIDATPPLNTLTIERDGVQIALDEELISITTANGADITQNPALLVNDQSDAFQIKVVLRTPADRGTYTYDFILADDEGLTDTESITVTTVEPGTDINPVSTDNVIFNASGPNQGAFDLDALMSTSSNSDASELQDNGINTDLPAASNWRRTISPENGAVMVEVNRDNLPEDYDFNEVQFVEEIEEAFDTGDAISGSTDVIEVGDEFVVQSTAGTLFLIQVTEVNATDNNNLDNYVFSVKY